MPKLFRVEVTRAEHRLPPAFVVGEQTDEQEIVNPGEDVEVLLRPGPGNQRTQNV